MATRSFGAGGASGKAMGAGNGFAVDSGGLVFLFLGGFFAALFAAFLIPRIPVIGFAPAA